MKVLNFGSLNYDYVYSVDHILVPGETSAAFQMEIFAGGKGLNQSIALARAGAAVYHAGLVGEDGGGLIDMCRTGGVNCSCIESVPGKSGHTIIQVDKHAQNGILLYGGSNRKITRDFVEKVIAGFEKGDMLLLQNEVNEIGYMIELAYQKGMTIALNPSPFDDNLKSCDLKKVSILLLNEIEGYQFSGKKEPQDILRFFAAQYPDTAVVLTLGKDGSLYQDRTHSVRQDIYPAKAVDTTAAGDTFTGFFLASLLKERPVEQALDLASRASSIAVSKKGAAPSIPTLEEVEQYQFRSE